MNADKNSSRNKLTMRVSLGVAFLAGALTVFSFAPFHLWPLALIAVGILFWRWSEAKTAKQAVFIGFSWNSGLLLAGASWLYVSLHDFGNMPAWLSALSVFLFSCFMSIYMAAAGAMFFHLAKNKSALYKLVIIAPSLFVAAEWLRGWVVTGFPWLTLGYSQVASGGWLIGFAPIFGVFGISWLLAITAGLVVCIISADKKIRVRCALGLAALWIGGLLFNQIAWSQPSGSLLKVALLQGNVPQQLKWRDDQRDAALENYRELVMQSDAQLIVMPETALTYFYHELPASYLDGLRKHVESNKGDLLLGVPAAESADKQSDSAFRYLNAVQSIGVSPPQRYAKDHLVAFGEFIPPLFSWVYQWLQIPLAGFTPGGQNQPLMRASDHLLSINICYEDAFGYEIARGLPDAELLVNVSNMAWYGHSLAADQHAQFSQMRSIETSRWMLRATNTGVTAAINERGEVVQALEQFTRGVLQVYVQPRSGATPYTKWRDWPVLLMVLLPFAWRKKRLEPQMNADKHG